MAEQVYDQREDVYNRRQLARTAHDVRHLCTCGPCGKLADDRDTVQGMHPKCFYEAHGTIGVLSLSSDDQAKFRICDIPLHLMQWMVGEGWLGCGHE